MKIKILFSSILIALSLSLSIANPPAKAIRVLVVVGGHDYEKEKFNEMMASLGDNINYQIAVFPAAWDMFKPENRNKYDVLVYYHYWQKFTDAQAADMADCIKQGKPLVVLHHAICGFDTWPEYRKIVGGKYYVKTTVVDGKELPAGTYIHGVHFKVKVVDPKNPVTKGMTDYDIVDETYKGYYVDKSSKAILTTDEPTSTPVVGWTTTYGKARVVSIEGGHDGEAYENPSYRKLLKQSIEWVYNKGKSQR